MLEQSHSLDDKKSFLLILMSVLSLHILFFFSLHIWHTPTKHPLPQRQKVLVQTIALNTGSKAMANVGLPEISEAVPHATNSEPAAKTEAISPPPKASKKVDKLKKESITATKVKEEKKIAPAKSAQKQPNPEAASQKEPENTRQQELLAKAKETIGKIGTKHDNLAKAAPAQSSTYKQIGSLSAETLTVDGVKGEFSSSEATYVDILVSRLRTMLKLPEYGEVTIALTLNRTGKVEKLLVINAASRRNREYVESEVPTIIFPRFDKQFSNESTYTFTITLSNE